MTESETVETVINKLKGLTKYRVWSMVVSNHCHDVWATDASTAEDFVKGLQTEEYDEGYRETGEIEITNVEESEGWN